MNLLLQNLLVILLAIGLTAQNLGNCGRAIVQVEVEDGKKIPCCQDFEDCIVTPAASGVPNGVPMSFSETSLLVHNTSGSKKKFRSKSISHHGA
jgi:hypothetical protein